MIKKGEDSMSRKVICPSCTSAVYSGTDPQLQDRVTCLVCGSFANIVGLDPFELVWSSSNQIDPYEPEYNLAYQDPLYDY